MYSLYILCLSMALSRRKVCWCALLTFVESNFNVMFYFFGAGLSLREVELVSAITSQLCSREFAEGRSLVLQEYYKIIYTCISLLFRCCVSLSAPPLPPLSLSLCARAKPYVAGWRMQHVLRFVESTGQFSVLSMS